MGVGQVHKSTKGKMIKEREVKNTKNRKNNKTAYSPFFLSFFDDLFMRFYKTGQVSTVFVMI